MDNIEDLEQGIEALLIGALLLADAILKEKSTRTTALMTQELRLLLQMTNARALDERSATVFHLRKAGDYLEKTIRPIDGGFNNRAARSEVKRLIGTLENLLHPSDHLINE